jgi:tetratricopeptide (TPR) repeat protein
MESEAHKNALLSAGIAAAKAGRADEARELLARLLELDPDSERAWLWMSDLVPDDEKIVCLQNVLEINPANELAQLGLAHLLQESAKEEGEVLTPSEAEGIRDTGEDVPEEHRTQVIEEAALPASRGRVARGVLAFLALITLAVCAAAAVLAAAVMTQAPTRPYPSEAASALPGVAGTVVSQPSSAASPEPVPMITPMPTYTLVVPEAAIPGFPIIGAGDYDEVSNRVQGLRGLQSMTQVQFAPWTRYRLEEYLVDWYGRPEHLEGMEAARRLYVALGLIDEEYDLSGDQIRTLREHIAGLYDSETKEIYLILDRYTSDLWLEVTYAHEFTHALQDQHFGLDRLYEDCPSSDCRLARQALVEGDATLVMTEYAFQYLFELSFEREDLLSAIQEVEQGEYKEAPSVVRQTAYFPYAQGVVFAAALVQSGGWEQLNRAFDDPPQTTEQLMHPDVYLAGDAGRAPEVGDATVALGPGWSELVRDSLGELVIRVYLERQLGAEEALMAAEGWGGDTAVLLADDDSKRHVLVLRVNWDSQSDAEEFLSLYDTFLRRAGARPMADTGPGCWRDETQVACPVPHGNETLLVLSSDVEAAEQAISAIPGF